MRRQDAVAEHAEPDGEATEREPHRSGLSGSVRGAGREQRNQNGARRDATDDPEVESRVLVVDVQSAEHAEGHEHRHRRAEHERGERGGMPRRGSRGTHPAISADRFST